MCDALVASCLCCLPFVDFDSHNSSSFSCSSPPQLREILLRLIRCNDDLLGNEEPAPSAPALASPALEDDDAEAGVCVCVL